MLASWCFSFGFVPCFQLSLNPHSPSLPLSLCPSFSSSRSQLIQMQPHQGLESWLPRSHWDTVSQMLVGHGQYVCTALAPKCHQCTISAFCPSSTVQVYKQREPDALTCVDPLSHATWRGNENNKKKSRHTMLECFSVTAEMGWTVLKLRCAVTLFTIPSMWIHLLLQ